MQKFTADIELHLRVWAYRASKNVFRIRRVCLVDEHGFCADALHLYPDLRVFELNHYAASQPIGQDGVCDISWLEPGVSVEVSAFSDTPKFGDADSGSTEPSSVTDWRLTHFGAFLPRADGIGEVNITRFIHREERDRVVASICKQWAKIPREKGKRVVC